MKKLLFLVLVCLVGTEGWGQTASCGVSSLSILEPLTPQREIELRRLENLRGLRTASNFTEKVIPVVVHVLYYNGSIKTDISVVEKAIVDLNKAFAAQGHYSSGIDTKISFCLIYTDWIESGKANFNISNDDLSKIQYGNRQLGWNSNNFLNIYVVDKINDGAFSGYSYISGALYNPIKFNGVAVYKNEFGRNITGTNIPTNLLPHEIGHYFGLYHTFQTNSIVQNCTSILCSYHGDQVCDTPPCDLSGFSNQSYPVGNGPDGNGWDTCPDDNKRDLEDNLMCYNKDETEPTKFTLGQIERMHDKIENNRSELFITNGCIGFENKYLEPNNTKLTASQIFPQINRAFNAILKSFKQTSSDKDYFKLNLGSIGKLKVTFTDLPPNTNIKLLDLSETVIPQPITNGNTILTFTNSVLPAPAVYVLVEGTGASSTTPYKLKVELSACSDDNEPNNSYAYQTNLFTTIGNLHTSSTQTIQSVISTGSDKDWFNLTLNGGGTLKVDLENLPKDYNVELMDANGNVVKNSDGSKVGSYKTGTTSETFSYRNIETNGYFIRVFPSNFELFELCTPYSLKATWIADGVCLPITATYAVTKASTANTNDGAINLTVTNAQSPRFLWSTGATTQNISGIGDGDYTVTVTGTGNCNKILKITVGTQSTATPFCSSTLTLTNPSGSFSDKSGASDYVNNSFCRWLIKPLNAQSIKLRFTAFKLHSSDKVRIYNGSSSNAPLLAEYNADTIPPSVTSTGGVMYVQFIADAANTSEGFSAAYTATIDDGINQITSFDYWFDDKFTEKRSFNVTERNSLTIQGNVPTDELSVGLHAINFRINDQYDQSSPITTDLFVKTPQNTEGGTSGINGYEYWYDSDFDARLGSSFDATEIFNLNEAFDASGLSYGVHAFNIRFNDNANNWSPTTTDLFVKVQAPSNGISQIVAYEYWFDDNYSTKVSQTVTPSESYTLLTNLNATALSYGLHTFQVRFLDAAGQWSTITTDIFVKVKQPTNGLNQIVSYEYWFDDKFDTKIKQSITPSETYTFLNNLNVTALAYGLHSFNVRFLDAAGQYSTTTTDLFIKERHTMGNLQIIQYQYWFDDSFQNKVSQTVTPIETYSLISNISTSSLLTGTHTISFRFLDESQNWSPIVKDTFTKGTIIPVELTKFTGKCQDNKVALQWQTASEKNNAYFELLQSTSPQSGWQTLAKIDSKSNGNQLTDYQYLVEKPSRMSYYRLKQVDLDRSFKYSATISVECANNDHYLKVYPNPTTDDLNVETDINDGDLTIDICNALGKSVLVKQYTSGFYPINIALTDLSSGIYFVKVSAGNRGIIGVKQIVKQ